MFRHTLARKGVSSLFRRTAVVATPMKYAFAIPMTQPRREMSTEKRVSLEDAIKMPKTYEDLSNDTLFILASMGNQEAREERLIREIMAVNKCTWEHAQPIFIEMCRANKVGMSIATLPYKVGILSAVTAAFASIPLVFDLNTVLWFNELFVTSDVPEEKDLETALEVGSWAWNWMEPPLGQISFFLLCLQFARAQMQNLQVHPYTEWLQNKRAARLTALYPQYNKIIVEDFAKGDKFKHEV